MVKTDGTLVIPHAVQQGLLGSVVLDNTADLACICFPACNCFRCNLTDLSDGDVCLSRQVCGGTYGSNNDCQLLFLRSRLLPCFCSFSSPWYHWWATHSVYLSALQTNNLNKVDLLLS